MYYRLQFANGRRFYFTYTSETELWMKKLAYIMQLTPCSLEPGFTRIIFIRRNLIDETEPTQNLSIDLQSSLPNFGWKLQNFYRFRFWLHTDTPDIICSLVDEESYELEITEMCMTVYLIYRLVHDSGCLPLHSALIENNGAGILLLGPSGIGKSTCCRRVPSHWRALSDDEVLVVPDLHGYYMAHPFPTWSDYLMRRKENTWDVQQYVPLYAIFFLERSQEDRVIAIDQGRSSIYINYSAKQVLDSSLSTMDREELLTTRKKLFDNACQIAKTIPAYKLQINLNDPFWEEIEKVLENIVLPT